MSNHTVSLKCRVRYEGRVRTFDRRATKGADLEKLPDPVWYGVVQSLQSKLRNKALSLGKGIKPLPATR